MHVGPVRFLDPPMAAFAASAGVERRLQRLVVHLLWKGPGQARAVHPLQCLPHRRARQAASAGDLVRRYRRRLQPNNLARTAHPDPLRWHLILLWGCQRGDLIRPTAAPANPQMTPGGIIPLWGRDHLGIGGRHHSVTRGDIIQELGAASSGISIRWTHKRIKRSAKHHNLTHFSTLPYRARAPATALPSLTGKRSQSAGMGTGCPGGINFRRSDRRLALSCQSAARSCQVLETGATMWRGKRLGRSCPPRRGSRQRKPLRRFGSATSKSLRCCGEHPKHLRGRDVACAVVCYASARLAVRARLDCLAGSSERLGQASPWRKRLGLVLRMRQPTEAAEQVALPRVCLSMARQNSSRASRRAGSLRWPWRSSYAPREGQRGCCPSRGRGAAGRSGTSIPRSQVNDSTPR